MKQPENNIELNNAKQQAVSSTCCYCGVGCGIIASKNAAGIIEVEGDKNNPVNKGMLCSKGKNLHYTVMDKSDRLLYPEMRYSKNEPRKRVSWDTALERTAAVFKTLIQKYGPDSVAFYASGQCLTEEYYVVNKLMKGFISSNNIDTNSRLCMSSAVVAYKMSLGEDIVPVNYDDIELADCIFVAGANPAWCHPILWRRVEAAKEKNPSLKIIVSDPRKTQSCSIADIHLQLNPGTDIALHHAIGRVLIEMDKIDVDFIKDHTEGFDQYKKIIFERSIIEYAAICGVDEKDILLAASYIGNAKAFIAMWTMGLNQSVVGVNKNLSLINLNLITGQIGKPGAGPFSLTGQPNAMGGREVGGLSNLLPAHRNLAIEADRNEVEKFWQIPLGTIQQKPGLTATEMFDALKEGKLKAIWIMCTNPLVSLPDARIAEAALKNAKFVVVQDISNKPETLLYADVVLPAAAWLEKEGTMTNAERRISYLHKLCDAPGQALPDAEIICRFANKMGFKGFDFENTSAIFDEHCALTAGTNIDASGVSYKLLKETGTVQWPYPKAYSDGAESRVGDSKKQRIFEDKIFYTPSKKAVIHSFSDVNKSEAPTTTYPMILTTGRIRDQWHTMSKTGKVNKLKQHIKEAFVEINPEDARLRGIKENDLVNIESTRANVRIKATITADIKKGVVFLPVHWGKILSNDLNRANNLTNNIIDPLSKEPDFKYTLVEVAAYLKPVQKIIVIGAGAASCGFVKTFRGLNKRDSIKVFSKENFPFYNRVMLPDYISGTQQWQQLIKVTDFEETELGIDLYRGISIDKIDRENKIVTDNNGNAHAYDVLIMATGSRAAMLKDVPDMQGIFSMRSRVDADKFKKHVQTIDGGVLVVGGGLLGIELAASLKEMGITVTIVHRTSKLMSRQLDALGSQLLHEELVHKNIDIYYNDEIERYFGNDYLTGVKLKSGLTINCSAIVVTVGTIPNIELAKSCGLQYKQGIEVNAYLQTNDPSIYAIGEIAEFKGILYGTTSAAEQQAEIVARFISGDISRFYEGSLMMNILKMHGTDITSMGITECPRDMAYEEVIFIDKAKRYYKKCITHQDRLVGAILIGDKTEFLEFRNLIQDKMELSEKRLQLLRSGKKPDVVIGKLVCSCNNIGEGNIIDKIKDGCTEIKQLCIASGAGQGCGSCRSEVLAILDKENMDVDAKMVTIKKSENVFA